MFPYQQTHHSYFIGKHVSLGIFKFPVGSTFPKLTHSLNLVMCLMFVMFGLDVWMKKKNAAFKRIREDGTAEILNGAGIPAIYCHFMGDFCIFYHGDFYYIPVI